MPAFHAAVDLSRYAAQGRGVRLARVMEHARPGSPTWLPRPTIGNANSTAPAVGIIARAGGQDANQRFFKAAASVLNLALFQAGVAALRSAGYLSLVSWVESSSPVLVAVTRWRNRDKVCDLAT